MEFYKGDIVKHLNNGKGKILGTSLKTVLVRWNTGRPEEWVIQSSLAVVERGKEYAKSFKIGDEVLVRRATFPEATIINICDDQVRVAYRSNKVCAWHSFDDIDRNIKKPELPNTIGSQILVHKNVWTLLPKYLTWLNGTFIPGVKEEDLLWVYTPGDKEPSLEYMKHKEIGRFKWALIRDAEVDLTRSESGITLGAWS